MHVISRHPVPLETFDRVGVERENSSAPCVVRADERAREAHDVVGEAMIDHPPHHLASMPKPDARDLVEAGVIVAPRLEPFRHPRLRDADSSRAGVSRRASARSTGRSRSPAPAAERVRTTASGAARPASHASSSPWSRERTSRAAPAASRARRREDGRSCTPHPDARGRDVPPRLRRPGRVRCRFRGGGTPRPRTRRAASRIPRSPTERYLGQREPDDRIVVPGADRDRLHRAKVTLVGMAWHRFEREKMPIGRERHPREPGRLPPVEGLNRQCGHDAPLEDVPPGRAAAARTPGRTAARRATPGAGSDNRLPRVPERSPGATRHR